MARPRSPAIAWRDDGIYSAWKAGSSLRELAERHNITPQRVGQILAVHHPDLEDETARALHRGRIENLITDLQDVMAHPGHVMAPNGRLATDLDGTPVENIGAKIEAARTLLTALESARRLDALDKPSRRVVQMEHSIAEQAALEDIARRKAELDAQMRVIAGEVIKELPPGDG